MENFCNTSLWNTTLTWDVDVPNITPCFRSTVLVWTPCSLTWFFALFEISTLVRLRRNPNPWSWLYILKLVFQALTFVACLAQLAASSISYLRHEADLAEVAGITIILCTLVLITLLTICARWKGMRSSVVIPLFWLLLALSTGLTAYSDLVEYAEGQLSIRVLCNFSLFLLALVQLVLSSLSDRVSPYRRLGVQTYHCVVKEWTLFPRLAFAYMWRIVILGYRNELELSSLNTLCTDLKCSTVSATFHRAAFKRHLSVGVDDDGNIVALNGPQRPKQRSLYFVVFKICRWELFVSSVAEVTQIVFSFLPPVMLSFLLEYLQNKEYGWHGYIYALGYAIFQFLSGVLDAHAVYLIGIGAYKVQSALVAALYKKVFAIDSCSRRRYTAGEVMNLMSVDVEEVSQFLLLSTQFWTVPLRIVMTLALLWHFLGPSCLATVAVMVLVSGATSYVARLCDKYQASAQMGFKDIRLRQINEILNGIKVLKLSAWELPFMEKVKETRTKELSFLKRFALLDSVFGFLWGVAPHVAALASFATFLMVSPNNHLTPSIAFASFSLFMLLRFPMGILPDVISRLVRFVVSLGRLSKFLSEPELDEHTVGGSPALGKSMTLEQATFAWSNQDSPVLKDINLHVTKGSLVAVVGSVGSGKSSLLSAILGNLEKISGSVDIQGRLAYVPQQSWIQNATVKGNIIFTNAVDEERYERVVDACALRPDIEMLPGGENTEIGEKGINLSGGQKLRLSLARAVYHDGDVYLLDDPFSAVDVHVATHLFEQVVGPTGLLRSKTRILVTHSVTFLPQVDWIVLLDKGVIKDQGTYSDLLAKNGSDFSTFLQKHIKGNSSSASLESADKEDTEGPAEEPKDKGEKVDSKLTDDEAIGTGYVGWRVYSEYLKRVGWKFLLPSVLAMAICYGSEFGSSVWLSKWSTDPEPSRRNGYLIGFGLFLVSTSIFNFVLWIVFMLGCLRAAASFHDQLLRSIMRSPLSFFDTTPMGRIVNRFSRDIESIDKDVPLCFNMTMTNIFWVSLLAVVVCILSAYFVAVVVLTLFFFLALTTISLPAFRHVHRLQSTTRSPLFSHFSETISGVASIRAFGVKQQFMRTLECRVDDNINCCYHSTGLDGYVALDVPRYGAWSTSPTGVFTVLYPPRIKSGSEVATNDGAETCCTFSPMSRSWRCSHLANDKILQGEAMTRKGQDQITPSRLARLRKTNGYSRKQKDLYVAPCNHSMMKCCGGCLYYKGRAGTLLCQQVRITVGCRVVSPYGLRCHISCLIKPVGSTGTAKVQLVCFSSYFPGSVVPPKEFLLLRDTFAQDGSRSREQRLLFFSAGQRQLVCLTRALLRQSKVLVLDEATSSVDLDTDHLVKETIRTEFRDTTIITIAHRLHTIMDCDRRVGALHLLVRIRVLEQQLYRASHPQQPWRSVRNLQHHMAWREHAERATTVMTLSFRIVKIFQHVISFLETMVKL
ncbi:unnamed protein product [Ixodes hexagonus]